MKLFWTLLLLIGTYVVCCQGWAKTKDKNKKVNSWFTKKANDATPKRAWTRAPRTTRTTRKRVVRTWATRKVPANGGWFKAKTTPAPTVAAARDQRYTCKNEFQSYFQCMKKNKPAEVQDSLVHLKQLHEGAMACLDENYCTAEPDRESLREYVSEMHGRLPGFVKNFVPKEKLTREAQNLPGHWEKAKEYWPHAKRFLKGKVGQRLIGCFYEKIVGSWVAKKVKEELGISNFELPKLDCLTPESIDAGEDSITHFDERYPKLKEFLKAKFQFVGRLVKCKHDWMEGNETVQPWGALKCMHEKRREIGFCPRTRYCDLRDQCVLDCGMSDGCQEDGLNILNKFCEIGKREVTRLKDDFKAMISRGRDVKQKDIFEKMCGITYAEMGKHKTTIVKTVSECLEAAEDGLKAEVALSEASLVAEEAAGLSGDELEKVKDDIAFNNEVLKVIKPCREKMDKYHRFVAPHTVAGVVFDDKPVPLEKLKFAEAVLHHIVKNWPDHCDFCNSTLDWCQEEVLLPSVAHI